MEIIIIIANSFWFQAIIKLILGGILAGIIGLERSSWSKPAGFRTHALVGISSVLIMLCGEYMSKIYDMDPSRIPAQLLSGIGFIGAGTILRDGFNVKGLTTAAGLLAVTCIGLSIGAGFYLGGIITTLIVYIILSYSYKISDKLDRFELLELDIKIAQEVKETLIEVEECLSNYQVEIKQMKRPKKEKKEDKEETIHFVGNYNKKDFKKNELIRKLASIENVEEVLQEES
ncbi:MAG: MgtC/SapB family protein [Clostridia bacterium]|nr:MgtC/SapB family protein [Clostridia bacterium]